MTVFVTVGTTKFDGLVKAVDDQNFQELLVRKGYKNLIIQLGNGTCHPSAKTDRLNVSWYTLKPSIAEDMKRSSLVISHGGSGCIRESLILHKPLVAVINDSLMDNHQTELVSQLAHDKHLIHSTPQ
jgi:beta-1,4-N-acetylglucosaminyltransferase